MKKESFIKSNGNWLDSMEWNHFCTFTSHHRLPLAKARDLMNRFFMIMEKLNPKARLFWVAEPFKTHYSYHVHILAFIPEKGAKATQISQKTLKTGWETVSGSKDSPVKVEPYKKGLGAHYYVSKHLNKHNADWDLLGEVS